MAATSLLPTLALAADEDDADSAEEEKGDEKKAEGEDDAPTKKEKQAAPPSSTSVGEGAISLTMTGTLFMYSQLSFVLTPTNMDDVAGTLTNTAWGPSTNSVTLEGAYGLSDHAFLGLYLELGGNTLATEMKAFQVNQKLQTARFLIGPKFEFIFSNSGHVRPFVMGVTGFTWAPQQDATQSISLSGFQALAGVGFRWHLTENFSIDPALKAGGGIGWGLVNQGTWRNVSAHGSLITAGAVIGLTGWLL
ncbi:MAG: hypothetical protein QM756_32685 [Polyangiaceae bacterium]